MKEKIALLGVATNLVLAVTKVMAAIYSGSTSVLADGLNSSMDVFASLISYAGIKIAKKPVDKKHPYGHYKYEVLAGLFITIIVFLTGIGIIKEAYDEFMAPAKIDTGLIPLGVMAFSAIANELMARLKIHYGKKENSISLISDGTHSRIDSLTSLTVFCGLFIANYWVHTDALLALIIGLYIIKESFSLGIETTDSLLDVSADEDIEKQILKVSKEAGVEVADLKTQKKGAAITANLEIKLPSDLSVKDATKLSQNFRNALMKKIETLEYIVIQIKSSDTTESFFRPRDLITSATMGDGFGWSRKKRMQTEVKDAKGGGPGGTCVCPNCGYSSKHERGIPCSKKECPKCHTKLQRE